MNLKVKELDRLRFDRDPFYIEDIGYRPEKIIQTTRLGIPKCRDEDLLYRFIDAEYVRSCTKK